MLSYLKNNEKVFSLIVLLIVLIALPFTIYLNSQRAPQETRTHANIEADVKTLNSTIIASPNSASALSAAAQRKELMKELAKTNPSLFIQNTINSAQRESLPPTVQEYLEKEVQVGGELYSRVFETDVESPDIYILSTADANGKSIEYQVSFQEKPELEQPEQVNLSGYLIDDTLVTSQRVTLSSDSVLGVTPGINKNVAVIMVRFSDNTPSQISSEYSKSTLTNMFFNDSKSVKAFHEQSSFRHFSLTGTVFDWVSINYTRKEGCNINKKEITDAADTKLREQGVDLSQYNYKFYYYTRVAPLEKPNGSYSNCSWRAVVRATGGTVAFANGRWDQKNDSVNTQNYAHEIGHLRGFYHAQALKCKGKAIDAYSRCDVDDYGDLFDMMGVNYSVYPDFSAFRKVEEGDIPLSNVVDLSPSPNVQRIRLVTSSKDASGTQLLRIRRLSIDPDDSYFIEYRQKIGMDSNLPANAVNGAIIRIAKSKIENRRLQTYLIDTNPSDATFNNAPMVDGRTFEDTENKIRITQVSHDSEAVTLDVLYNTGALPPQTTPVPPNPTAVPTTRPTTPPNPTSAPTPKPVQAYVPSGFQDTSSCTISSGWTCDPNDYNQALDVNFYADGPVGSGSFIGSIKANQARPDLPPAGVCGGNQNHGWTFTTPEKLKDGKPHSIYAYAINIGPSGKNPLLNGSPKTITCAPPTGGVTSAPTTQPTQEPTPPPVPIVQGKTYIVIDLGLHGIGKTGDNSNPIANSGNKNPKKKALIQKIMLYSSSNKKVMDTSANIVYADSTQSFKGTIEIPKQVTPGPYSLYVSVPGYLIKRVNITLKEGVNNVAIELEAGDFNEDGKRDLLDWNIINACSVFITKNQAVCSSNSTFKENSDLNKDGVVDQDDMTLWIREFSVGLKSN